MKRIVIVAARFIFSPRSAYRKELGCGLAQTRPLYCANRCADGDHAGSNGALARKLFVTLRVARLRSSASDRRCGRD